MRWNDLDMPTNLSTSLKNLCNQLQSLVELRERYLLVPLGAEMFTKVLEECNVDVF
jgi:hypothetical protein